MKKFLLVLFLGQISASSADQYNFYFPQFSEYTVSSDVPDADARVVKIINASTYTTIDGDLSGYYGLSYSALDTAGNNYDSSAAFEASIDFTGTSQEVLDFVGTDLTIRENRLIQLNDNSGRSDAPTYYYDRIVTTNIETGAVVSQILVAENQAAYDIAVAAGYDTKLAETSIDRSGADYKTLTTFSKNLTNDSSITANFKSDGGLISEKIVNGEGESIFREESDGTIHIGQNSIVLADELVSNSGYDQIHSSSGVLELGNDSAHRTVVTGALDVQNPSSPQNAANKRYTDAGDAYTLDSAKAYSDNGDAATLSTAKTYADTGDAATLSTAKTYADTGDAATLSIGKTYADTGDAATLSTAKTYAAGLSAITMASSSLNLSIGNRDAFGIATGFVDGESAIAMGLSKKLGGNTRLNISGGYSSGASVAAFGAAVSWGF